MTTRRTRPAGFLAGMMIGIALTATVGCQTPVNTRNDPGFVEGADRFVNQTVGPEYEAYVANDPALGPIGTDTPARQSRYENVRSFRDAVSQAKTETAQTGG